MPIGAKVTLRRKNVRFLDKLVNVSLPRVRDYGVSANRSMVAVIIH